MSMVRNVVGIEKIMRRDRAEPIEYAALAQVIVWGCDDMIASIKAETELSVIDSGDKAVARIFGQANKFWNMR